MGGIAINSSFIDLLLPYQLNIIEDTSRLIVLQMIRNYNQLTKEKEEDREAMSKPLAEVDKKIDRLEERFTAEEIDREMFTRYNEKESGNKTDLSNVPALVELSGNRTRCPNIFVESFLHAYFIINCRR